MAQSNFLQKYHPTIIGSLSALSIGIIIYYLGSLSGSEAKILIKQSIDNFNMLCNTITIASATILALLLSALGSSRSSDANINKNHYIGIIHLTTIVTITFIASLFSFLLMNVPITETDAITSTQYTTFYWAMLIVSSILVGLTISIGLMLRKLIINIIKFTALEVENDDSDNQNKKKTE